MKQRALLRTAAAVLPGRRAERAGMALKKLKYHCSSIAVSSSRTKDHR